MLLLPRPKRAAMFAIYAFCRQVDDIVDEPGPLEEKRAALAAWREQVRSLYLGGAPVGPVATGLADAIVRYHLPRGELEAVIDGMAMDLGTPLRAPRSIRCASIAGGSQGRSDCWRYGCSTAPTPRPRLSPWPSATRSR